MKIKAAQNWEKVRNVKSSEQFREFLENINEVVLPLARGRARPEGGPVSDVLGQPEYELADVQGRPAVHGHGPDRVIDLVADRGPRLGPATAEELHDAELSHLAPERPVVGEGHVGPVATVRIVVHQVHVPDERPPFWSRGIRFPAKPRQQKQEQEGDNKVYHHVFLSL
nr:hypothetical protein Iba_scaffold1402834CG0010 [Ipomoea batatas]